MTTLLLSSRHTEDDQSLWRAAVKRGWNVERARGITIPEIEDSEIIIYIEALFAPEIARKLRKRLVDPAENWLAELPTEFSKRKIELRSLGEARKLKNLAFIKPPNDKSFSAAVYENGSLLPLEFDDSMQVLVADPVSWLNEYRCFCYECKVMTISPYIRSGVLAKHSDYTASNNELAEASQFAETVLNDSRHNLPKAIVLDVGQIANQGWAVVEANGAWGSGIYGCDPNQVLDVIRHATEKIA